MANEKEAQRIEHGELVTAGNFCTGLIRGGGVASAHTAPAEKLLTKILKKLDEAVDAIEQPSKK